MTWPAGAISTANLDSGVVDSPAAARAQLKQAVDVVNEIVAHGAPRLLTDEVLGALIGVQTFESTAGAVYTATPGTAFVVVEIQAAGGPGGGAPVAPAGQSSAGSGGGAGAYMKVLVREGFDGVLVVAPAGAAGVAGSNGPAGGDAMFGDFTCRGGLGGIAEVTAAATYPRGVVASGFPSEINVAAPAGSYQLIQVRRGKTGGSALLLSALCAQAGAGADSMMGSARSAVVLTSGVAGSAAGPGAGGGGAVAGPTNGPFAGATAGGALVVVWEYAG